TDPCSALGAAADAHAADLAGLLVHTLGGTLCDTFRPWTAHVILADEHDDDDDDDNNHSVGEGGDISDLVATAAGVTCCALIFSCHQRLFPSHLLSSSLLTALTSAPHANINPFDAIDPFAAAAAVKSPPATTAFHPAIFSPPPPAVDTAAPPTTLLLPHHLHPPPAPRSAVVVPRGAAVPRGPARPLARGPAPAARRMLSPRQQQPDQYHPGSASSSSSSAAGSSSSLIEITADYLADLLLKSGVANKQAAAAATAAGISGSPGSSDSSTATTASASAAASQAVSDSSTRAATAVPSVEVSTVSSSVSTRRNSISSDDDSDDRTNQPNTKDASCGEGITTDGTPAGATATAVPSILLLDVRSYVNFASARVSSAVNLPSTLLRRAVHGVDKLVDTLASDQTKALFRAYTSSNGPLQGRMAFSEPGTRAASPERQRHTEDLGQQLAISGPPTSDDVDANTEVAAEKGRDEVADSQDTPASAVGAASPAPPPAPALSRFDHIVLYDADSERLPDNSPIALLGAKFARERTLLGRSTTMGWLKGGFKAFVERYGDLVERPATASDDRSPGSAAVQANNSLLLPSQNVEVEAAAASAARAAAAAASVIDPDTSLAALETYGIFRSGGNTDAAGDSRLPAFLRDLCASPDPRADVLARWQLLERDEAARVGMAYRARGPADPFSASVGITAGTRNRYPNIWPFNDNRVRLAAADVTAAATSDPNGQDPASDYINASFVLPPFNCTYFRETLRAALPPSPQPLSQLPQSPAASPLSVAVMVPPSRYIATQAPLPATFEAFWQMVWDHDVRVILMLCELSGRTAPYWPSATPPPLPTLTPSASLADPASPPPATPTATPVATVPPTMLFGPRLSVTLLSERRVRSHVYLRSFRLAYTATTATTAAGPAAAAVSSRVVAHIHYTAWPDTAVPTHPDELLALRFLVAQVRAAVEPPLQQPERPILVHCSAGCGRT
ncbi:hypothetical protein HK405_008232, partial [Cladochytrium tenue]